MLVHVGFLTITGERQSAGFNSYVADGCIIMLSFCIIDHFLKTVLFLLCAAKPISLK